MIAERIATAAHTDQYDRLGVPYIEHLKAVVALLRCSASYAALTLEEQGIAVAVAWLHDVIEDCDYTVARLMAAGVSQEVALRVLILSRVKGITDEDYYAAVRGDPITLAVKLADLAHNLNERRMAALQALEDQGMLKKGTRQRLEDRKYPKALAALGVARADLPSLAEQS